MKATFLDKLLGRMDRIDPASLQTYMQRLAWEKAFLETTFNTIKEGLIVADAEGLIRYVNRAACDLLGMDSAEAVGDPIGHYLREVDWTRFIGADPDEFGK